MKIPVLIISHLLVAILSPVIFVGSFGIYTQHRIAEMDKQSDMVSAFNNPHLILDQDHYQSPMRRLMNKKLFEPNAPSQPQ